MIQPTLTFPSGHTSRGGGWEMRGASVEARLLSKIEKTETCWLWIGGTNRDGYGLIRLDRRTQGAHRVAYSTWVGPIPDDLVIDHLCRVRNCINPEHLEAVEGAVNTLRGISFAAHYAGRTHCGRGHEFNLENTEPRESDGTGRRCRTCRRARQYANEHGLSVEQVLADRGQLIEHAA